MDPFEYVVVLTSLILGLGIAQILSGTADVLSNLKNTKLYIPHILFVLVIFLLHIQEWWINYQYAAEVPVWTLKIVLCVLSYPILLFLMARMIFPTGIRGNETDFKEYYSDQWRYLFIIGIGTVLLSTLQNVVISEISITDQLPQLSYLAVYLIFVIGNIKNEIAHYAFQIISFFIWFTYVIIDNSYLEAYN